MDGFVEFTREKSFFLKVYNAALFKTFVHKTPGDILPDTEHGYIHPVNFVRRHTFFFDFFVIYIFFSYIFSTLKVFYKQIKRIGSVELGSHDEAVRFRKYKLDCSLEYRFPPPRRCKSRLRVSVSSSKKKIRGRYEINAIFKTSAESTLGFSSFA